MEAENRQHINTALVEEHLRHSAFNLLVKCTHQRFNKSPGSVWWRTVLQAGFYIKMSPCSCCASALSHHNHLKMPFLSCGAHIWQTQSYLCVFRWTGISPEQVILLKQDSLFLGAVFARVTPPCAAGKQLRVDCRLKQVGPGGVSLARSEGHKERQIKMEEWWRTLAAD